MSANKNTLMKTIADIARQAETLAVDLIGGATQIDVKDRAWQLGEEIRDVYADKHDPDRLQILNASKAVKLLIDAIRCANYAKGNTREKAVKAVEACAEFTKSIAV